MAPEIIYSDLQTIENQNVDIHNLLLKMKMLIKISKRKTKSLTVKKVLNLQQIPWRHISIIQLLKFNS